MAIELPRDKQKEIVASLKRYFREELDEDIGDLKAGLLLDYVLKEIGPSVYNHAIRDAQKYFQERVTDLDGVCYEEELGYWEDS